MAHASPGPFSARLTTLVFDWGNTLMVNFPQFSGQMVTWPEVAAVEGADQTLAALQSTFRLAVGTNAYESRSHARPVRQALARVGLERHFKAVFTAADLGSLKPDPAFFHGIEGILGCTPAQAAMVGDSYQDDVMGAHQAGWTAIWFNPGRAAAPGLLPLFDLEISHLADLPLALARAPLPSYEECLAWLLGQPTSANLLAHVQGVASVAYQLAVWLRAAGQPVDALLAHRGGLLHDLAKIKSMQRAPENRLSHGEWGARLLEDRGQPVLAEIARRHQLFSLLTPQTCPQTWEQKLVYFADKLVEGGRVASINERIAALRQRYPHDDQNITRTTPALLALRDEICSAAGLPPDELISRLRAAMLA